MDSEVCASGGQANRRLVEEGVRRVSRLDLREVVGASVVVKRRGLCSR